MQLWLNGSPKVPLRLFEGLYRCPPAGRDLQEQSPALMLSGLEPNVMNHGVKHARINCSGGRAHLFTLVLACLAPLPRPFKFVPQPPDLTPMTPKAPFRLCRHSGSSGCGGVAVNAVLTLETWLSHRKHTAARAPGPSPTCPLRCCVTHLCVLCLTSLRRSARI